MKLETGCYLMSFKPTIVDNCGQSEPACIGTLRVTGGKKGIPLRVSGDLYEMDTESPSIATSEILDHAYEKAQPAALSGMPGPLFVDSWKARRVSFDEGWKAKTNSRSIPIPHFPAESYRYYLEVHEVIETPQGFTLDTTAHGYIRDEGKLVARTRMPIQLTPTNDPRTWEGSLRNGDQERGQFHLQRINKRIRAAELRLFAMTPKGSEPIVFPGENPDRMTAKLAKARKASETLLSVTQQDGAVDVRVPGWKELFRSIGWELTVTKPAAAASRRLFKPKEWAAYDLGNAAVVLRKERAEVESKNGEGTGPRWFYDLLCVPAFESPMQEQDLTQGANKERGKALPNKYLGIMFDSEATDLNHQPRESAAVAALQMLKCKGKKVPFQDLLGGAAYYRTALHELGHAMNLTHNFQGNSIMNTTGRLLQLPARRGRHNQNAVPLRFDAIWKFSPEDTEWLQHAPDIAVRPGGISRRGVRLRKELRPAPGPISLKDASDLLLTLQPLKETFPLGAPIRLDYELQNRGSGQKVPKDISLRGGYVLGRVTGRDHVTRFFRSAFRCCDTAAAEPGLHLLPGDEAIGSSMTILRGIDGALFPESGPYKIEVEIRWDADGQTHRVVGETSVAVAPVSRQDPAHAVAAALILNSSAVMPALVQGLIDDENEGLRVLSVALRSAVLAPHYLPTALKCRIMGEKHGVKWDKKLGVRPDAVELPPSNDAESAPASGPSVRASRSISTETPSSPERDVVQTRREKTQFDMELRPARVARGSKRPFKEIGPSKIVVSAETNAWLDEVRNLTVPEERLSVTSGGGAARRSRRTGAQKSPGSVVKK